MDEEFDSSTAAAWTRFQAQLADHLLELEEHDLLLLEAESSLDDADGAAPYVQFCAWGPGQLRCEAVSNTYLAPTHRLDDARLVAIEELGFEAPSHDAGEAADDGSANFWIDVDHDEADRLAVMAVRALRDVYGVAHPVFLTGLPAGDQEVGPAPVEPSADEEAAVFPVDGPDQLQRLVDETLTPGIGHAPVHDDDGDIPIECGDVVVFVRVLGDKPVIRLFACVARDVVDLGRASFEVGVLNRDRLFFKFLLVGDAIVMQTDIVAWPFAPAQLRDLLEQMCRDVGQIHGDLAARLGASPTPVVSEPSEVSATGGNHERPHPAMLTLLELDADEPGSVDPALAAAICEHDRDLVLGLLAWNEHREEADPGQAQRMHTLLRGALRVTVERQARSAGRRGSRGAGRRVPGASRTRVPDPTLEEVDPEMGR